MRLVLLILLLGSALPCLAQQKAPRCPNGNNLGQLCIAIMDAQKDPSGEYQFRYQKIVSEAACAKSSDSEAVASAKVRAMWEQFEDRLTCNHVRFDVQNGSVLKYAASARFEDLLFDAAVIWKVDLNRVDQSDGRTLLDYVSKEIEQNKGNAVEPKLKSYYDMLRTAGAKHRSEL